jgi:hypothetical protein
VVAYNLFQVLWLVRRVINTHLLEGLEPADVQRFLKEVKGKLRNEFVLEHILAPIILTRHPQHWTDLGNYLLLSLLRVQLRKSLCINGHPPTPLHMLNSRHQSQYPCSDNRTLPISYRRIEEASIGFGAEQGNAI